VNVPGSSISEGDVKATYRGPGPPKGTGLHRYVFLAFEQPGGKIDAKTNFTSVPSRAKFSMRTFIQDYDLNKVPTAGNYFQAQYASA
jgi:phosphatidylethanolamine-binding protein (PEBP) family uncharacterized protein